MRIRVGIWVEKLKDTDKYTLFLGQRGRHEGRSWKISGLPWEVRDGMEEAFFTPCGKL